MQGRFSSDVLASLLAAPAWGISLERAWASVVMVIPPASKVPTTVPIRLTPQLCRAPGTLFPCSGWKGALVLLPPSIYTRLVLNKAAIYFFGE